MLNPILTKPFLKSLSSLCLFEESFLLNSSAVSGRSSMPVYKLPRSFGVPSTCGFSQRLFKIEVFNFLFIKTHLIKLSISLSGRLLR
jgi:hypothetical protein